MNEYDEDVTGAIAEAAFLEWYLGDEDDDE